MEQEKQSSELSRRNFLALGSVAAAGAVGLGMLAGCSPTEQDSGTADATGNEGDTSIPTGYQCSQDWLGEAPVISEDEITETVECDVLVLGGGHAGIQAALTASEGGAKVAVVEMSPEATRKVKGEDIGHVNSQWLIDQGYGPYDEGEVVNEFCVRTNGRVNPELIRKYVANSGEMFDNLIGLVEWPNDAIRVGDAIDPSISPLDPSQLIVQVPGAAEDGPVTYPMHRGGYKSWAAVAQFMGPIQHESAQGVAAFSRLDEVQQFAILKGQDLGAEWHYEETAITLIQDTSGVVSGAITQKSDGSYVQYNASTGVILCTGDYAANGEMVWNLNTEISEWAARAGKTAEEVTGFSTSDGAGHKMGCWAGGFIEPSPRAVMSMGGGGGGPWGTSPYLWVNANGERYMNESATLLAWPQTLRQPAGTVATITDSKWYETMKLASLDHGAPNYGRPVYFEELKEDMAAVPVGDPAGGTCRSCTIAERMASTVYAADTLEELAGLLGYEGDAVDTLVATVAHYNELCAAGADTDYGKDADVMISIDEPPYYGAPTTNERTSTAGLVTLAGLVTDNDLRVVDNDLNPIEGLWAAGNCLGSRYGGGYATPFAGNSIGMAMTHGYVAGKLITGQDVS